MVAKPSRSSSQGIFSAFAERWFCGDFLLFVNPIPVLVFKVLTQLVSVSMRQRTQIRLKGLRERLLVELTLTILPYSCFKLSEYPMFRFASKQAVVRQNHVAQVINSLPDIADGNFLGMQGKFQPVADEFLEGFNEAFQKFFIARHHHKVVGVACVMFDLHLVLNELVEFVHVDVGKQLRSEIADRQAMAIKERRLTGRKASNNLLHKPHSVRINDPLLENCQQNFVINRIEKFPHVAFEHKARPRVVPTLLADHALCGQHALVRALAHAAGKRGGNKVLLKERVQNPENSMVQNPVAHLRFVNVANFRAPDIEARIRSVGVATAEQIPVQGEQILLKRKFERLYIGLLALVASKFLPRRNDVFE